MSDWRINSCALLISMLIVACLAVVPSASGQEFPGHFVFVKKTVVNSPEPPGRKMDSLSAGTLPDDIRSLGPLIRAGETELHLEVRQDSIWRYILQEGKMIGDYQMVRKNAGVLYYFDKKRTINYLTKDLFSDPQPAEITEYRNDRKEFHGFDCYKLVMIQKEPESDLGDTRYEMYVTDQIPLPLHSVLNIDRLIPETFPMEIKISGEHLPGVYEYYLLTSLESDRR